MPDRHRTPPTLSPVDALTERLARELARVQGLDPDEIDSDDTPRWRWFVRDVDAIRRAVAAIGSSIVPTAPAPCMVDAAESELRRLMPAFVSLPKEWRDGREGAERLWQAMLAASDTKPAS